MDLLDEQIALLKARIAELEVYRSAFAASPIGMTIASREGKIVDVNPSGLRLLGMERDQVLGRAEAELGLLEAGGSGRSATFAVQVREQGSVSNAEAIVRTRSGERQVVKLVVDRVELHDEPGFIAAFLDITEQNQAIERRSASEVRYRQIVETALEGIAISDAQGRYTFMNRRFEEIFNYEPGQMLGMDVFELIDEDSRDRAQRILLRLRQGITEGGEIKLKRRGGQVVWIRFKSSPIVDDKGDYAGALLMVLDIPEDHQAEELLRRSEIQLRQAQEIAQIGSWEWDLRTGSVVRSAELCRILGRSHEEFGTSSKQSYDHIHADDRERVRVNLERAIATRQPYDIAYRIVRPDGIRFIHSRGLQVCDEEGNPIRALGTLQDVTDGKQAEARLRLADRMASIGVLAAGVAHEINNPLTYIISNLDLLADDIRDVAGGAPSEHQCEQMALIAEARQGGEQVRRIVLGMKTFSRADEEERRVLLDVKQVLDVAVNMAFTEIRHRARLVKKYGDVPQIEADEARLAQVFINLLVNAAQAIPEGQAERNEIHVVARKDDAGRALIEVRDTGPGISPEVLGRVFEPFFTTKPPGVGTGLGLSICHGIVTGLGGELTVESEPGKGTVFRIVLPPAQRGGETPGETSTAEVYTGKRARILVVDDNATVGKTFRRILKDHDVTVFTDARGARDHITSGERYDVLFCDLMMPEMTGMEFHAEVARTTPEQADRIIFVTGGAFTPAATEFLERVPNERLDKPFDSNALRALVQRRLR
jgi:PAS domain S-box-containing protein